MSISLLLYWVVSILNVGIVGLALWKGGPAERMGAGFIIGIIILGALVSLILPPQTHSVLYLVEDGLTAVGLLAIALRYASLWLGGAMLVYALLFTLHAFYFVMGKAPDILFIDINNVAFMGVSASLGVGTFMSWRARVRKRAASPSE
jgi:hypothetical protein